MSEILQLKEEELNIKELYSKDNLPQEVISELESFQKTLNTSIENSTKNVEDFLLNSNEYHASLLLTELLKKTEKQLNMVVGNFDGRVSNIGGYANQLNICLKKGVDAKIIFLNDNINKESKTYKVLSENRQAGAKVKFYMATQKTKELIKESFEKYGGNVHFSTFDSDKYRAEIVPEKYVAFASFNAPLETKKYINIFDTLLKTSTEIK